MIMKSCWDLCLFLIYTHIFALRQSHQHINFNLSLFNEGLEGSHEVRRIGGQLILPESKSNHTLPPLESKPNHILPPLESKPNHTRPPLESKSDSALHQLDCHNCGGKSKHLRIRKEFRDLTKAEWLDFKSALLKMQTLKGLDNYNHWAGTHNHYSMIAHNTPLFFPWHRMFVWEFETALRRINPTLTVPYWEWTYDAMAPLTSPIFSETYLGIKLLPHGDCRYKRKYFKKHCLLRQYDPLNFGTFYDNYTISRIIENKSLDYASFQALVEPAPHGVVHSSIGGANGDMSTMVSPNDPIFWLHHAFIDKIWDDHQSVTGNYSDYNGQMNGAQVNLDQAVPPFNVTVGEIMKISDIGYAYSPFKHKKRQSTNAFPPKIPKPLPASWIKEQMMNETQVRKSEIALVDIMLRGNKQQLDKYRKEYKNLMKKEN